MFPIRSFFNPLQFFICHTANFDYLLDAAELDHDYDSEDKRRRACTVPERCPEKLEVFAL